MTIAINIIAIISTAYCHITDKDKLFGWMMLANAILLGINIGRLL